MKSHILVFWLSCLFATTTAAPALVWKNGASPTPTMHHSEEISIQSLLPQEQGVVFVLQRLPNGEEALTSMASQLTQTAAVPAHCQHHSVTGVTSAHLLARSVPKAAEVTLEEYLQLPQVIQQLKTSQGKVSMKSKQRAQTLETATVLFVTVDTTEQDRLDPALVQAIHQEPHVVLTAVRSLQEINHEKEQAMQYTMQMHREAARRRLEEDADQQGQDNAQENMQINNNNQYEYMNLVHMTPNILSGILFTILFATITLIGITCMGSIQGQDVYVKKMPSIGREA
ncbi:hypothetical protein FisN_26Hh158 [Fistulifera solaris]|uniref:CNNM transmembrane domain-containing protein n=1 Tax=Fistulifera solaris TaxID=1519565 RepID=A0A1Z5JY92_FISSO|nr:hypothetical protein FisN_26Hh158 [Fistulifera solaris]|eukprot:GAX18856.1 hypothetical protein FisN_26Hh158 [Fistulifera solaris]